MLELGVFRNRRFSAASASITFVYFALMGVMYFMTSYLQSVLGHSALEAGYRMLPIAAGMILAAKSAVAVTARLGTKVVVAAGLTIVAGALVMTTGFDGGTGDGPLCLALGLMGLGIGFAMVPATESIMGSLPREKAGIGSAMNDVVREVGGTLGIAVLGSVLAGAYTSTMEPAVAGLPPEAATAASDGVGAAQQVGTQIGGSSGAELIATANQAFVDAMSTTAGIAAVIAIAGALIAAALLPSRPRTTEPSLPAGALPEGAPA